MTTVESLQALTDEQLIEKVAVEVMGWEKDPKAQYDNGLFKKPGRKGPCLRFNPLHDWNHTMEVWEKATADCALGTPIHLKLLKGANHQRNICLAALLAVSQPQP